MKQRIPTLDEFINEASKPGRAWSGKIANIDKLLSWLYDKDILKKGDKNKKDSFFYQYYRYYNDGDIPRGLPVRFSRDEIKYSEYSRQQLERMLEDKIEDYIKSILSKYRGKYDRQEFRYDTALSNYRTLKSIIHDNEFYSLLSYWSKSIKVNDSEFEKLLDTAQKQFDKLRAAVDKAIEEYPDAPDSWGFTLSKNKTISSTKEALEEIGLWDDKLEKVYGEIDATFRKMEDIVDGIIEATELAKKTFLGN